MKQLVIVVMLCFACRVAIGGEHDEGAAEEGAAFKEGSGVILQEVTRKAIGLTTVEVGETTLDDELPFTAQIYRTANERSQNAGEQQGYAYASGILPASSAKGLANLTNATITFAGLSVTGMLIRVEDSMASSTGQSEVIIEIPDPQQRLEIGDFVQASLHKGTSGMIVTLPLSAVLNTADTTFAFVRNGEALMRTAITTGLQQGDRVEVVDGLYAGDEVAATAVETLYLIELRATKGGGHCH